MTVHRLRRSPYARFSCVDRSLAVLASIALVACGTTDPADRFQLVVNSQEGLRLVNATGTDARLFFTDSMDTSYPNCSRDGAHVAYVRVSIPLPGRAANDISRLYVVHIDGKERRELAVPGLQLGPAAWSPDGSRLAAHYYGSGTDRGVVLVNFDGTGFTKVPGTAGAVADVPSWSPDGSELLYVADLHVVPTVMAVNLASGATRVIAPGRGARWSPDGSLIALIDGQEVGATATESIVTVDRNGGNRRVLVPSTTLAGYTRGLTWLPDGTRIVYERQRQLMSVGVTDGQSVPFAKEDFHVWSPHWCGTP